jgi:hypothetical protein
MRQPLYWLFTMMVSPLTCVCMQVARRVIDDRPRPVLLQLLVDLPDKAPTLFLIGHRRLLDEQRLDLLVAIAGIVAFRPAAVILEELLVGIVHPTAGVVKADLLVLAGELGEPVRGLDRVEFAIDPDPLELVDQVHRGVAIGRDGRLVIAQPLRCRVRPRPVAAARRPGSAALDR